MLDKCHFELVLGVLRVTPPMFTGTRTYIFSVARTYIPTEWGPSRVFLVCWEIGTQVAPINHSQQANPPPSLHHAQLTFSCLVFQLRMWVWESQDTEERVRTSSEKRRGRQDSQGDEWEGEGGVCLGGSTYLLLRPAQLIQVRNKEGSNSWCGE